jgi:hypothetical protein
MKKKRLLFFIVSTLGLVYTVPSSATDEVETYERKVVVEKGTATWCQYCVRSIVGFRTMYEKYPDNFIGIAMHDDDMYTPSYISMLWRISGGLPKATMNRKHEIDPNETALENYYQYEIDKARARILMEATWEDEQQTKAVIRTTTRFAQDMDGEFRIAYAVTENNVGPYLQSNYYSGVGYDMGGFEQEGSYVNMLHDHVARSISAVDGEPNSVPVNPQGSVDYEFTYTLSLPDNIDNKENIELIVLLINQTTGEIENADVKKFADIQAFGTTDISQISATSSSAEAYYDLYGRRYSEKPKQSGVYIHRGNKIIIQ